MDSNSNLSVTSTTIASSSTVSDYDRKKRIQESAHSGDQNAKDALYELKAEGDKYLIKALQSLEAAGTNVIILYDCQKEGKSNIKKIIATSDLMEYQDYSEAISEMLFRTRLKKDTEAHSYNVEVAETLKWRHGITETSENKGAIKTKSNESLLSFIQDDFYAEGFKIPANAEALLKRSNPTFIRSEPFKFTHKNPSMVPYKVKKHIFGTSRQTSIQSTKDSKGRFVKKTSPGSV